MSALIFDFCDTSRVVQEIPPDERPVQSMNGWPYSPRPRTPYQRTFKAKLFGLRWYVINEGIDKFPTLNNYIGVEPTPLLHTPTSIVFGYPSQPSITLNVTQVGSNTKKYNVGSVISGQNYLLKITVDNAGSGVRVLVGTNNNPSQLFSSNLALGNNEFTVAASGSYTDVIVTFENITGSTPFVISSASFRQLNSVGLDIDLDPKHNAGRLLQFYRQHRTWDSFLLNHEYLGVIRVRFNKPVVIPEGIPNSLGQIDDFELEFIEHNPSY